MPGVDEMHLLNITVVPAWQGCGLAVAMLDRLEVKLPGLGDGTGALPGLQGPAEADGVGLRHVRAHDQDAVAIGHILHVVRGRTAAE